MRGDVAMSGNFGYELDLTRFTDEEKEIVKQQIADYKEIRPLVQFGDMYRLLSPFEGNETAWMIVSEDKTQALVAYFRVLAEPNAPLKTLRLKGLNPALRLSNRRLMKGNILAIIFFTPVFQSPAYMEISKVKYGCSTASRNSEKKH